MVRMLSPWLWLLQLTVLSLTGCIVDEVPTSDGPEIRSLDDSPEANSAVDDGVSEDRYVNQVGRDFGELDSEDDSSADADFIRDQGPPTPLDAMTPIDADINDDSPQFVQLYGGRQVFCALTPEGRPSCWGAPVARAITNSLSNRRWRHLALGPPSLYSNANYPYDGVCGIDQSGVGRCWRVRGSMLTVIDDLNRVLADRTTIDIVVSHYAICALTAEEVAPICSSFPLRQGFPAVDFWRVDDVPQFTQLTVSANYICGLDAEGNAFCWDTSDPLASTQRVQGGLSFQSLSFAGPTAEDTICVSVGLTNTGQIACIQRDDESLNASVLDTGDLTFTALRGSLRHSCATTSNDETVCWGEHQSGQLGIGPVTGETNRFLSGQLTPIGIRGLSEVTPLARSFTSVIDESVLYRSPDIDQTCALNDAGSLMCWGRQLYDHWITDTPFSSEVIVQPLGEDEVKSFKISGSFVCALNDVGETYCWGDNRGQLVTEDRGVLLYTRPQLRDDLPRFTQLIGGPLSTCGRQDDGHWYCWGEFNDLGYVQPTPRFEQLYVNIASLCALDVNGVVWCLTSSGFMPQNSEQSFSEIAISSSYVRGICGISGEGSDNVFCWGSQYRDADGLPIRLNLNEISATRIVTNIYASGEYFCASDDVEVRCWRPLVSHLFSEGRTLGGRPSGSIEDLFFLPDQICARSQGRVECAVIPFEDVELEFERLDEPLFDELDPIQSNGRLRCGLNSNRLLRCSGADEYGQLGRGSHVLLNRPALAPAIRAY